MLDDAAFGAATPVTPKYISLSDPASRWTAAQAGPASFAYCTNYLIDVDHALIVDVEPSTAVRQGELGATRTMLDRTQERFDLWPERLTADTAYGSAEMLNWLVHERGIEPHIPVFDKSARDDGPSPAATSPTTTPPTPTPAPRGSNSCTAGAASGAHEPASPRPTSSSTGPASTTAIPAR